MLSRETVPCQPCSRTLLAKGETACTWANPVPSSSLFSNTFDFCVYVYTGDNPHYLQESSAISSSREDEETSWAYILFCLPPLFFTSLCWTKENNKKRWWKFVFLKRRKGKRRKNQRKKKETIERSRKTSHDRKRRKKRFLFVGICIGTWPCREFCICPPFFPPYASIPHTTHTLEWKFQDWQSAFHKQIECNTKKRAGKDPYEASSSSEMDLNENRSRPSDASDRMRRLAEENAKS